MPEEPSQRLVLVHADEHIRASVRAALGESFHITEHHDTPSLLAILRTAPPAVLLLNMNLQREDAFPLLRQLSQSPDLARTVIVVLTSASDGELSARARHMGVADVIEKPFDLDGLRTRVADALSYRRFVSRGRHRIGTVLVRGSVITQEQLESAIATQKETGGRLGRILVSEGYLSERELVDALAQQLGIGVADLSHLAPDAAAVALLPRDFIMRHRLLPLGIDERDRLVLAMTDPLDVVSMDEVKLRTGKRVRRLVCTESGFEEAVSVFLSSRGTLRKTTEGSSEPPPDAALALDASVIEDVDALISDAAAMQASDIHLEPAVDTLRGRCRIDGVLHELRRFPPHMAPGITSRLKIMGGMDIAERRLPQDGRTSFETADGRQVDLRLATIPSLYGENVTIRLLETSPTIPSLSDLGLTGAALERFETAARIPEGGIVVSGPTGSGKSTTLYAALETINTPDRKIYTVEDPIERGIDGIIQTEIKEGIGLTFARALRALVRADPDVIMVGEIRDLDTARMAADAAITGHLVFTTLHANDAAATIYRLLEIGLPRYVVAAAFRCVVAQRLVRRLCHHCRKPETLSAERWEQLGLGPAPAESVDVLSPAGCRRCFGTGYLGRVGLFEVLTLNDALREVITGGGVATDLRRAAAGAGVTTVREDGVAKVLQGVTSYAELLRVTA